MKKLAGAGIFAMSLFLMAPCAQAGQWMRDDTGWWWLDDDGTYPRNWSRWLDGNQDGVYELYYFDENGYLYMDTVLFDGTTPVDANGAALGPDGQVLTERCDPDARVIARIEERRTEELSAAEVWKSQMDAGINVTGQNLPVYEESENSIRKMGVHELSYLIAEEVNRVREENGREPLTIEEELMENAMERAREAAESCGADGQLSHLRPDGNRGGSVVERPNYGVGENLYLKGIADTSDAPAAAKAYVRDWMASSGHRRNILKEDYTETGVGACVTEDGIITAQLFVIGNTD